MFFSLTFLECTWSNETDTIYYYTEEQSSPTIANVYTFKFARNPGVPYSSPMPYSRYLLYFLFFFLFWRLIKHAHIAQNIAHLKYYRNIFVNIAKYFIATLQF